MKRISLLFIAILAILLTVDAQTDTVEVQKQMTDTHIEYTDTPASKPDTSSANPFSSKREIGLSVDFDSLPETVVPIIAMGCVFGFPVLIIFIVFFFKYKNKKAKYRLAEQALAAGQPIPAEFFNQKLESGVLQKGISNTFIGIGLFVFLGAITKDFGIGCIGLFVMFMGIGQIVIHYTQVDRKNRKKPDSTDTEFPTE